MMKKKLNNKKGFTLAELLIVVAIIGILVAVSTPVFTSKLGEARKATDLANVRAAKAAATTKYLSEEKSGTFYYDANAGVLKTVEDKGSIKAYGKSSTAIDESDASNAPKNGILKVVINTDGSVNLEWETTSTVTTP